MQLTRTHNDVCRACLFVCMCVTVLIVSDGHHQDEGDAQGKEATKKYIVRIPRARIEAGAAAKRASEAEDAGTKVEWARVHAMCARHPVHMYRRM